MSKVSDFKTSPFDIYNQTNTLNDNYFSTPTTPYNGYTGTGLNGIPDYSYNTLCGTKWSTDDGRILTLVSNSANAQAAGTLLASPAEETDFEGLAVPTPASPYLATAGTNQVLITNGGSVLDDNIFAQGYFVVTSGTGIGQSLQIASHPAAAASANVVITLTDPLTITLDDTSVVSLFLNPFMNVVATTAPLAPVGVTLYNIPASVAATFDGDGNPVLLGVPQYAFVVSNGPVGVLFDTDATALGYPIGASDLTAGAVGTATLTTQPQIGISTMTQTSAEVGMVTMQL